MLVYILNYGTLLWYDPNQRMLSQNHSTVRWHWIELALPRTIPDDRHNPQMFASHSRSWPLIQRWPRTGLSIGTVRTSKRPPPNKQGKPEVTILRKLAYQLLQTPIVTLGFFLCRLIPIITMGRSLLQPRASDPSSTTAVRITTSKMANNKQL
jgi:hypothetical protein